MDRNAFANRKQRRQAASIERRTGGLLVDPAELEALHHMQRYFVALVKQQGRVRVDDATLSGLREGDTVRKKSAEGCTMLSFVNVLEEEKEPA